MNAKEIVALLKNRHKEDRAVDEISQTVNDKLVRIDFWAMQRGTGTIFGYEIKVDRRDFLNDSKWHLYKDFCNELYFICPRKMIMPEELPNEIGLMWVSDKGKIFKKKPAVRRELEPRKRLNIVESILWNRCKITDKNIVWAKTKQTNFEFFKEWLECKGNSRTVGHRVSKALARTIQKEIEEAHRENMELCAENDMLQDFKEEIESMSSCGLRNGLQSAINDIKYRNIRSTAIIRNPLADSVSTIERLLEGLKNNVKNIDEIIESAKGSAK